SKIPTPFENEGVPDGVWYFHLRAKDNAGNVSEKSTYKITVQGEETVRPWQKVKDNFKMPDAVKKLWP
ncbi:hypothetical protein HZA41_03270, partial [Candidatus Peregrinibacteria bacterium]|nr:hypothetical protein [Candidatus Peregrinibacteria bacterium]